MKTLKEYKLKIDVNAMYDDSLASIFFEENFETLSDDRFDKFCYYTDGKEFEWDINKLSKKDLLEIINDDEYSLKDSKDNLIERVLQEYREKELFVYIVKWYPKFLKKLGFKWYGSRGYTQGDYCYVILDLHNYDTDTKYIDNLLWDSPISCNIELTFTKELEDNFYENYKVIFDLTDWLSDIYDITSFNKEKVLNAIVTDVKFDISYEQKEQIENCLNNLDYRAIKYKY